MEIYQVKKGTLYSAVKEELTNAQNRLERLKKEGASERAIASTEALIKKLSSDLKVLENR